MYTGRVIVVGCLQSLPVIRLPIKIIAPVLSLTGVSVPVSPPLHGFSMIVKAGILGTAVIQTVQTFKTSFIEWRAVAVWIF